MEFKCKKDTDVSTDSKSSIYSSPVDCSNFFRLPHNFSTPPSRSAKISNPFEYRLIDKLNLPTFSPSVFAMQSTPKTDRKFKWTIEDISCLKPANIDENTISQHVLDSDPHVESLVQQKIDQLFNEKVIVPSPMVDTVRVPLIAPSPECLFSPSVVKKYCEGSTQTVLSLPPILPAHIEDILKPYFLSEVEEPKTITKEIKNTSLYQNLFNDHNTSDCDIQDEKYHLPCREKKYVPLSSYIPPIPDRCRDSLLLDTPSELQDCCLSPITENDNETSPVAIRSAARLLDFSNNMSIDVSLCVPDISNIMFNNSDTQALSAQFSQQLPEVISDSPVNWDMENRHVSFVSTSCSSDVNMDMSNSNTPHTKMFTSQRKRLSNSFNIEIDEEINNPDRNSSLNTTNIARKLFKIDTTDAGYYTQGLSCEDSSPNVEMYASTPTKTQRN